jgi:hypothetical protein
MFPAVSSSLLVDKVKNFPISPAHLNMNLGLYRILACRVQDGQKHTSHNEGPVVICCGSPPTPSRSLSHGLWMLCTYLGSLQANSLSHPTVMRPYSRIQRVSYEEKTQYTLGRPRDR